MICQAEENLIKTLFQREEKCIINWMREIGTVNSKINYACNKAETSGYLEDVNAEIAMSEILINSLTLWKCYFHK